MAKIQVEIILTKNIHIEIPDEKYLSMERSSQEQRFITRCVFKKFREEVKTLDDFKKLKMKRENTVIIEFDNGLTQIG